jgi:hypothetical protein
MSVISFHDCAEKVKSARLAGVLQRVARRRNRPLR